MQQHYSFLRRTQLSEKAIPLVFLCVLFLGFGLVISSLGIYQDDWVFVYNAYVRGPHGLRDFLNMDGTPFSSFINVTLFSLLGFKPLYWHLAALIARWLTVVAFWLVLRQLWPANPTQNFLAALIFAIHPFFILQPLAFTFLHIWLGYFFLGFSLWCMILSVQNPKRFWIYLILSLTAETITGLTLEYFMGLELLRPIVLWLVLSGREENVRHRLVKVIRLWIPYLMGLFAYSWWRFFVFAGHRNNPVGVQTLLSDPMAEILVILSNFFPDVLSIIVTAWYKVLDPLFFNLTDRRNLLFVFLSAAVGIIIFVVFSWQHNQEKEDHQTNSVWAHQALWFGLIIIVLGLIPPYVGGLYIVAKNPLWSSRLGLASMLGASILVVALLELFSPKAKTRFITAAVLIGLSVGYHARYTNDFRWAWKKEQNLYRQLVLRIPGLEPHSALSADGEILYYMGDYPTAFAINTIYSQPLSDPDNNVDYWFFSISSNFHRVIDDFMNGMDIEASHHAMNFKGRSDKSLIISFEPDLGQCLYVIRPEDVSFRKLSPLLKRASHLSALDRIQTFADPSSPFLQEIGSKYPEDWCTFYQKADLARQTGDYEQVIELWKSARKSGFAPGAHFEYFPFLDAFTQLERWEDAVGLTFEASRVFPIGRPSLCDYWISLPMSAARDAAFERVESKLNCFSK